MLDRVLVALLIAIFACAGLPQAGYGQDRPAPVSWARYTNVRFQYTLCWPENLFAAQPEAENSDGRVFLGKDGSKITVFGSNNALSRSMKEAAAEAAKDLTDRGGQVTYQVVKASWFVVSGRIGPEISYLKTLFNRRDDQFKTFEITYDASKAATYGPLVTHMAACFVDDAR